VTASLVGVHPSVEAARRALARAFRERGLDTPELDARLIVGHALGLDHSALAARSSCPLTGDQVQAISALAARRLAREPVARIVGRKEFWGLSLRVNSATLLPRPETETLVEAVLIERPKRDALCIADLGTGSGALLLALLTELPGASGIGTDISTDALACARDNAAAFELCARTRFVACDYGGALAGPIDVLVCNPPYIAHGVIAGLEPEVRDYDPPRSLDGGADGLDGYRAIAADAGRLLAPGGILVVEVGLGQAATAGAVFMAAGLATAALKHDLSGVARALVLRPAP
jgi:release factor glutamine methyltransferase